MTYKAAVADLPLGGGKGVIMLPDGGRSTRERARTPRCSTSATPSTRSAGSYITAEDVGTSSRDMSVIAERTTARRRAARAGAAARATRARSPRSASTSRSGPAASACSARARCAAARSACRARPRRLARREAAAPRPGRSSCSPTSIRSKRTLAEELGASWTTPDERARRRGRRAGARARSAASSTTRPCPRLRCRIIAGAANNQLADDRIADLLAARGRSCGRRTSWSTPAASSTSPRSSTSYEPGERPPARTPDRRHAATRSSTDAETDVGSRPLAAANELARERLRRRRHARPRVSAASRAGPGAPRRRAAGPRRRACPGAPRASRSRPAAAAAARRPRRRRAARRRCACPRPAPRPAAARGPAGARCTRRAWPRDRRPAARGPGTSTRQLAPRSRASAVEVAGERAGVGRDEHAPLAEHRVAGQRHVADDEREVVGRVARGRDRLERAERGRRRRAARRRRRAPPPAARPGTAPASPAPPRRDRRGRGSATIPPRPPRRVDLCRQRREVLVERRPGIDQPRRIAADDPGVGARERERPRVGGPDPDDLAARQLDPGHAVTEVSACVTGQPLRCQVPTPPPAT